jgi:Raf kinase inhibitor-like YbhB/YbcL family protein
MLVVVLGLAFAVGCPAQPPSASVSTAEGAPKMSIVVSSTAFQNEQTIPKKYTGEGVDVSPPLAWSGQPTGTQELVLICDDPDAPSPQPWVHWVIYKIPGDATGLTEGVAPEPRPAAPAGALQGKNSWPTGRTVGYRGPMPPPGHGVHHYHYTLYALNAKLDVQPGISKRELLQHMEGKVLATGRLTGLYERR